MKSTGYTSSGMRNQARAVILANALIWAAVILASSMVLEGSEHARRISSILGGGAAGSIIVLGGGLRRWLR